MKLSDIKEGDIIWRIKRGKIEDQVQSFKVQEVRTGYRYYENGEAVICNGWAVKPTQCYPTKDLATAQRRHELTLMLKALDA